MPKTGNIFLDFFSFLSTLLPLVVSGTILIKKNYHTDSLNFLMIVCLLNFIKNLLSFSFVLPTSLENIITNIFSLLEFVLLILIFKNFLVEQKIKNAGNLLFSIFLSVVITIYFSTGIDRKMFFVPLLLNGIQIFVSLTCIGKITTSERLDIFSMPLFWIAIGTLFYFTAIILLQFFSPFYEKATNENASEKMLLIDIGNIARYFFYLLAVVLATPHQKKEEDIY